MLERISIATPCSADWDDMPGTDQVRHCAQCDKNVYNLSAMTRRQAEALLRETEGHLCARLYRRADGTILTGNCPVGLRNLGRRISRAAGAAMSAMLTISSSTAAHLPLFQIAQEQTAKAAISGTVQDQAKAGISHARIEVTQAGSQQKFVTQSDEVGDFRLGPLERGEYTIEVTVPGFLKFVRKAIIGATDYKLTVVMDIGPVTMGGAIVSQAPSRKAKKSKAF